MESRPITHTSTASKSSVRRISWTEVSPLGWIESGPVYVVTSSLPLRSTPAAGVKRTTRNAEPSTVVVWSDSPYTGTAEGDVYFVRDFRLRLRQEIDFDARLIAAYGYEIYRGAEKLF